MAFKEDWSFLDKITMGAVGTEKVIEQLNKLGHNIIELERYCTSNKIWSTKIKRLRIPDLLCLNCGKRIESRAKSKLGIIMSDAATNPDRRWFVGLRDNDMVAFIQCYKDVSGRWNSEGVINLFSVGSLKSKEDQTKLSAPKSVNEGAERDRTWKSYVPSFDFTVESIEQEGEKRRLRLIKSNGRRQSKLISNDEYIYVKCGESYPANSKIASGIVPMEEDFSCTPEKRYDFIKDLESSENETVYTAVKALGFLERNDHAISELKKIVSNPHIDKRIRLEGYSSLLRLGENVWDEFETFALSSEEKEIRMEFVLILGELTELPTTEILIKIAREPSYDSELRAAAIWSLNASSIETQKLIIDFCFNQDEVIANHAIAKLEKSFKRSLTPFILQRFGNNEIINAICARILSICENSDEHAIVQAYLRATNTDVKNWILFTMGLSGRGRYEQTLKKYDENYKDTITKLTLMWDYQPLFLDDTRIEAIDFIKMQK